MNTKGFRDLQETVDELINEISTEESQTQNSISKLIENVDDTFQDAESQIDTTVQDINKKTEGLEQNVRANLNSAINSLNNSKIRYDENFSWYRNHFENDLTGFIFYLILMIIVYDFVVSWLYQFIESKWPSITYQLFGFSVVNSLLFIVKFVVIIYIFIKIWDSLTELTQKMQTDNKKLEVEKNQLSSINPDIGEIDISKQKFSRTTPLFSTAKNTLGSLMVSVSKTSPTISLVYSQLTLMTKYGKIVDDFKFSLQYYGIPIDDQFFSDLKEQVPAEAQIIEDENTWTQYIIERIESHYYKKAKLSSSVITLLYCEHNGVNTNTIFRSILESQEELKKLAQVLISSNKLIQPSKNPKYSLVDITQLLNRLDTFNLSDLNNDLSKSLRLLDYVNSYVIFLINNGIHVSITPTIDFLVREEDKSHPEFEHQVINYCMKIGKPAFDFELPTALELSDGFTRASISIKFQNEISMKKIACSVSGINEATAVIKAYYEKTNETEGKTTVTLKELINNLPLIYSYLAEKETIEFQFLRTQLNSGEWYDSSAAYLKVFFETNTKRIEEQIKNLEKFSILRKIVKDTFTQVKIGTVEKAIDAQVFGAYIIMVHSDRGNLAPLVNELSIRNLSDSNSEKRWDIKTPGELDEAERKNGVRPKYDFVNFSDNTRIGVFGKGKSFTDLQNSFLQDVKKILIYKYPNARHDDKFEIGLVIQRISPTKYSLGILDNSQIADFVEVKNLDVATHIARLAVANVSAEEQAGVIKNEKDMNILKILDHYSIYELIRIENDDCGEKERKVLESEEIKKGILSQLEWMGINSFKSLAYVLGKKQKTRSEILKAIRNEFIKHFQNEPGLIRTKDVRADLLSKRFVDVFEALYQLYEIQ